MKTGSIEAWPRIGSGVDIVDIAAFASQLQREGSVFATVFSDKERAVLDLHTKQSFVFEGTLATTNAQGKETENTAPPLPLHASLAARWAGKEAFVKAWSALLVGRPPVIAEHDFCWEEVQVLSDVWHRPYLHFTGHLAKCLQNWEHAQQVNVNWQISLSHDGNYAIALVQALATAHIPHTN
ncbi:MAG: holo-ACP synthase [Actinomycetaceae bacterium]|nr:holo-ACP synthase [Actinomycetaceae bacterium]